MSAQLWCCCSNGRPSTLVLGTRCNAFSMLPVAACRAAALCWGVCSLGQCCWVGVLALSWRWRLAGELAAEWLAGLHCLLVLARSSLLGLMGPFPLGFVSVVTHMENLCGDGRGVPEVSVCGRCLESLKSCSVLCFIGCFRVGFGLLRCESAQAAWLLGLVKQFL